jgi:hypothetical protein
LLKEEMASGEAEVEGHLASKREVLSPAPVLPKKNPKLKDRKGSSVHQLMDWHIEVRPCDDVQNEFSHGEGPVLNPAAMAMSQANSEAHMVASTDAKCPEQANPWRWKYEGDAGTWGGLAWVLWSVAHGKNEGVLQTLL